jgi:hypothetical protein
VPPSGDSTAVSRATTLEDKAVPVSALLKMLTKLSNKSVAGTGFRVSVPDVHRVLYFEGEKKMTVEIEGGTDAFAQVDWLVYAQTLRAWDPPHEMDAISGEKWEQILARISESLDVIGMRHTIIK